jgi:hypothetical protein
VSSRLFGDVAAPRPRKSIVAWRFSTRRLYTTDGNSRVHWMTGVAIARRHPLAGIAHPFYNGKACRTVWRVLRHPDKEVPRAIVDEHLSRKKDQADEWQFAG